MEVFCHHIYEYQKGLRNLILHTTDQSKRMEIIAKLEKREIAYLIYPVLGKKINVFFGDKRCIDVLKQIGKACLNDYTPEEDYILGIMLGYDRLKQCERYMKLKNNALHSSDKLIG